MFKNPLLLIALVLTGFIAIFQLEFASVVKSRCTSLL